MKKFTTALLLVVLSAVPQPVAAQTTPNASGVRACLYVQGISTPAQLPKVVADASTSTPFPTPTLPAKSSVDAGITARQLRIQRGLWNAVNDNYVYQDFRGRDWKAIGAKYEALIRSGLSDKDFYAAMQAMINELGDDHSYFQSPADVQDEKTRQENRYNFVGIGVQLVSLADIDSAVVISVFPDGPAAKAGLRPHDVILKVDGGPVREKTGESRTLGPEGTTMTLTIQRPGESPHAVTLTRRRVTGMWPLDYCLVPGTHIGYIFIPTLLDETLASQIRAALKKMTVEKPLDGLIIDNRMNGGGSGNVTESIMGLFASGLQGHYISRTERKELRLKPENVNGSQTVPLVILVSNNTVSYAEIMSGVLRLAGRAKLVGETTRGNVERLRRYDLEGGSRAWIAGDTFEPVGKANGSWEGVGIAPDVAVPARWEQFTEANDPALAKAIELLTPK